MNPGNIPSRTRSPRAGGPAAADGDPVGAFLDIHCHGGGGVAFDDPVESAAELAPALEVHRAGGTGAVVASLVSNPIPVLEASCRRLAGFMDRGEASLPGIDMVGLHLEGPWLDPGHRGAHSPAHLRPASVEDAARLLDAAGGWLRQVTVAPEHDPGLRVTRYLVERGVTVAVGHTDADYDRARAAFDAGASLLTHAFNAMNGIHHRRPGPVLAAVRAGHVFLEAIADGFHLHPAAVESLFRMAPGRVVLVTDAMSATGCSDGEYALGDLEVEVRDGKARLATDDGTPGAIAGSTLTLDRAVRLCTEAGVPAQEAVAAASTVPARALGIAPGPQAPAAVRDEDVE